MERPIIFSAPMVRALLGGTKTQTRRVVMDAAEIARGPWEGPARLHESGDWQIKVQTYNSWKTLPVRYAVGDRLWVRESIYHLPHGRGFDATHGMNGTVAYLADGKGEWYARARAAGAKSIPAIHMPRWASRLTLLVTDVRVERLQAISEADCWAEGVENCGEVDGGRSIPGHGRDLFRSLWNSINGPEAWDANPWVVAVSFNVESPAQRGAEG